MNDENLISTAIDLIGLSALARALGVAYQTLQEWEDRARLPRSEFVGTTTYAQEIQKLTDGALQADRILEWSRVGWHRAKKSTAS